jgi:uncharacterized Fe-S cluster protein YjdI/CDGSH-type Zn-finger protein
MAKRDYEGPGITVHWDSDLCIHSERCVNGAPSVFDRASRPWVNAAALPADQVAEVIDRCPSGALTYTRTEAPVRETAVVVRQTASITPEVDGPYVVVGPLTLIEADGGTRELIRATLCRCGQSANKPFCDGTHHVVGFRAPGVAQPYDAAGAGRS